MPQAYFLFSILFAETVLNVHAAFRDQHVVAVVVLVGVFLFL